MRRWSLLLLCVLGLASCHSPRLLVWWGNQLHVRGEYADATIHYIRAEERQQEDGVILYDLGNVYYALGETEAAARSLETSTRAGDDAELIFRSSFNLGNVSYEMGEYARAAEYYIDALKAKPNDVDAKVNLEIAQRKAQNAGGQTERTSHASEEAVLDEVFEKILGIIDEKEEMIWRTVESSERGQQSDDW